MDAAELADEGSGVGNRVVERGLAVGLLRALLGHVVEPIELGGERHHLAQDGVEGEERELVATWLQRGDDVVDRSPGPVDGAVDGHTPAHVDQDGDAQRRVAREDAVESPGAAGPGRDGAPRHFRVRTLP